MSKQFIKEHKLIYMILLFLMLIVLNSCDAFERSGKNYIRVSGEVIEKYEESHLHYRRGRYRRTYRQYLKVSYVYHGETYYAEGIKANFWEKEGSRIHLFISPFQSHSPTRGAMTLRLWDAVILLALFLSILIEVWRQRDSIFSGSHSFTPPSEEHYLYYEPETPEERAFYHSALNVVEKDLPEPDFTPQGFVPPEPAQNVSSEEASSSQEEKDASFHDIPVIQIPDEFKH